MFCAPCKLNMIILVINVICMSIGQFYNYSHRCASLDEHVRI